MRDPRPTIPPPPPDPEDKPAADVVMPHDRISRGRSHFAREARYSLPTTRTPTTEK